MELSNLLFANHGTQLNLVAPERSVRLQHASFITQVCSTKLATSRLLFRFAVS